MLLMAGKKRPCYNQKEIIHQKEKEIFLINVSKVFLMSLNTTLMMPEKLRFRDLFLSIMLMTIFLIKYLCNLMLKCKIFCLKEPIDHPITCIRYIEINKRLITLPILLIILHNMDIKLMDKKCIMKMWIR